MNFVKISKNTFSNKTPAVVASEIWEIVKLTTLQRNLLIEVTGSRESDNYARNVYIKVFLEVTVPWILVPSKILHQNTNKLVGKYLQLVR